MADVKAVKKTLDLKSSADQGAFANYLLNGTSDLPSGDIRNHIYTAMGLNPLSDKEPQLLAAVKSFDPSQYDLTAMPDLATKLAAAKQNNSAFERAVNKRQAEAKAKEEKEKAEKETKAKEEKANKIAAEVKLNPADLKVVEKYLTDPNSLSGTDYTAHKTFLTGAGNGTLAKLKDLKQDGSDVSIVGYLALCELNHLPRLSAAISAHVSNTKSIGEHVAALAKQAGEQIAKIEKEQHEKEEAEKIEKERKAQEEKERKAKEEAQKKFEAAKKAVKAEMKNAVVPYSRTATREFTSGYDTKHYERIAQLLLTPTSAQYGSDYKANKSLVLGADGKMTPEMAAWLEFDAKEEKVADKDKVGPRFVTACANSSNPTLQSFARLLGDHKALETSVGDLVKAAKQAETDIEYFTLLHKALQNPSSGDAKDLLTSYPNLVDSNGHPAGNLDLLYRGGVNSTYKKYLQDIGLTDFVTLIGGANIQTQVNLLCKRAVELRTPPPRPAPPPPPPPLSAAPPPSGATEVKLPEADAKKLQTYLKSNGDYASLGNIPYLFASSTNEQAFLTALTASPGYSIAITPVSSGSTREQAAINTLLAHNSPELQNKLKGLSTPSASHSPVVVSTSTLPSSSSTPLLPRTSSGCDDKWCTDFAESKDVQTKLLAYWSARNTLITQLSSHMTGNSSDEKKQAAGKMLDQAEREIALSINYETKADSKNSATIRKNVTDIVTRELMVARSQDWNNGSGHFDPPAVERKDSYSHALIDLTMASLGKLGSGMKLPDLLHEYPETQRHNPTDTSGIPNAVVAAREAGRKKLEENFEALGKVGEAKIDRKSDGNCSGTMSAFKADAMYQMCASFIQSAPESKSGVKMLYLKFGDTTGNEDAAKACQYAAFRAALDHGPAKVSGLTDPDLLLVQRMIESRSKFIQNHSEQVGKSASNLFRLIANITSYTTDIDERAQLSRALARLVVSDPSMSDIDKTAALNHMYRSLEHAEKSSKVKAGTYTNEFMYGVYQQPDDEAMMKQLVHDNPTASSSLGNWEEQFKTRSGLRVY